MSDTIHVLALGAGVQSSTLALMMACGEIETADVAIFADTQAEPAEVYRWLDWLEKQLPFPVHRVTAGNLAQDSLRVRTSAKSGKRYINARIPAFVAKPNGEKWLLGRRCTQDYKIAPMTRKMRELLGRRSIRKTEGILARQALGISADEAHRMKPSRETWIESYWPLVDAGITRDQCMQWMQDKGYPAPPRSACSFCPFHSDKEWIRLRDEHPADFESSVTYERALRAALREDETIDGDVFLHSSLQPLDTVAFKDRSGHAQVEMFGNECEGLCGV